MQWQLLIFAMVPAAVFVVARGVLDERRAIALSIAAAAIECVYDSYRLGFLEAYSLYSFGLFAILGVLSIRTSDALYFKFQPVLLGISVAVVFLVYQWAFDTLLFAVILEDYVGMKDVVPAYERGYFSIYARAMAQMIPFLLIFHAGLTAYAAMKLSVWSWFLIRTVGLYLLIAVAFVAQRLWVGSS